VSKTPSIKMTIILVDLHLVLSVDACCELSQ
jgi:hypothetical protein